MAKYKLIIESFDEKKVFNCEGNKTDKGFDLDKFKFIILNEDALLIENSVPLNNRIPLKKNILFPFKYNSYYGEMNLHSKLIEFRYSEEDLYCEYELFNNNEIIGNYKVTLYIKDKMN